MMSTERLRLRMWTPEDDGDVAAAFDIYRRPEVAQWLSRPPRPWASLGATRERLRRWVNLSTEQPGYALWAVEPRDLGSPVGTVLLVPLPLADGSLTADVEVGWHFHPDHWGRGYATEAARAVLHHAFADLHLPVVNALAYEGNDSSTAVMHRLGMVHRGRSDRWYGAEFDWWTIEP